MICMIQIYTKSKYLMKFILKYFYKNIIGKCVEKSDILHNTGKSGIASKSLFFNYVLLIIFDF